MLDIAVLSDWDEQEGHPTHPERVKPTVLSQTPGHGWLENGDLTALSPSLSGIVISQ